MRRFLIICIAMLCVHAAATGQQASLDIVVVSGYGQPRQSCRIELFRSLDEPLADGGFKEYTRSFRGLRARSLPLGRYEAWARCADGTSGHKEIQVDRAVDFEVIATSERLFRTHDDKPILRIRLLAPVKSGEVWWVRFIGLYVAADVSAQFGSSDGNATLTDPPPGRYLVLVRSSSGFECSKRIDIFDAPEAWSFNPAGCVFVVDGRGRLVADP